jgi:hypothetical protein
MTLRVSRRLSSGCPSCPTRRVHPFPSGPGPMTGTAMSPTTLPLSRRTMSAGSSLARKMRKASSLACSMLDPLRRLLVDGLAPLSLAVPASVASLWVSLLSRLVPLRTLPLPTLPTLTPWSRSARKPVVCGTPTRPSRLLRLSVTSTMASSCPS